MRMTSISVSLEKMASDGDYGREKAEVRLNAELEPSDDPEMSLRILQDLARAQVEADLGRSANLKVRRALIRQLRLCNRCGDPLADEEHSYLHPTCSELERAERQAKYDALTAKEVERWAQSNANAEAHAIGNDTMATGSDDDELVGVGAADADDEDLPL